MDSGQQPSKGEDEANIKELDAAEPMRL